MYEIYQGIYGFCSLRANADQMPDEKPGSILVDIKDQR
jgi:hypothetical protein